MICYAPPQMTSVPIAKAVNRIRTVDAHGAGVQAARALGICFGDNSAQNPFVVPTGSAIAGGGTEWDAEATLALAQSAADLALAE